ncbi:tenascin-X-like [Scaptodrosophila lebanonensis]|uniref:Tenascin-X-like n=1 Tax=Drosophila lebanonensis TaxID=7225 RepID=A0A6J2TKI5_DROLE|nr:tenascin-X-like [Scaptodrosophila lebanonensis]
MLPVNIILFLFLPLVTANVDKDPNLCLESKIVYYTEMDMSGKRFGNLFGLPFSPGKIVNKTRLEPYHTCCAGYSRDSQEHKCQPICSKGCPAHSTCAEPDECVCGSGYADGHDGTCQPVCSPACGNNSYCKEPDVCPCNPGYARSTKAVRGDCKPICDYPTCGLNSACVSPNQCKCAEGYEEVDANKTIYNCKPRCHETCINATCSSPNYCTCNEGYQYVSDRNGTACKPICEGCQFGDCISPGNCHCWEGPDCPTGLCSVPGTCNCEQGHRWNGTVCEPQCEQCESNSYCQKPGVCACNEGYHMVKDNNQCVPKCSEECGAHSFCAQPEECRCQPGYAKVANASCQPTCESRCPPNTHCGAPNTCLCQEGYYLDDHELCQPRCTNCGKHSHCTAPGVCVCDEGYLKAHWSTDCLPKCIMYCGDHGHCSSPGHCECDAGYEKNQFGACQRICLSACGANSHCTGNGVCECIAGYATKDVASAEGCQLISNNSDSLLAAVPLTTTATATIGTTSTTVRFVPWRTESPSATTTEKVKPTTRAGAVPRKILELDFAISQAVSLCANKCECWKEYDELGPLSSSSCTKLCINGLKTSCLDLSYCRCNPSSDLICNGTSPVSGEINSDSAESDEIRFVCTKAPSKPSPATDPSQGKAELHADKVGTKWPTILGWCLVASLLVMAVVGSTLLYLRHKRQNAARGSYSSPGLLSESFEEDL